MSEPKPPEGKLTPIGRSRLLSSIDILDNPVEGITYQHTIFCQTCLPYKNPGNVRVWERQQGVITLRIEAGAVKNPATNRFMEVGLPYGSRPRLIMAHLNREALLNNSPRIDVGRSLTSFIKRIQNGRTPTGTQVRHFKDQLTRFAAAIVRMAVKLPENREHQITAPIVQAMDLWLEKNERQRVLWPEVVELSPLYFESLTAHAVPLDERAIGALANSAMALDVYAWLTQRLCRVRGTQFVAWSNLKDQFGQEFSHMFNFKAHFRRVLELVASQYPTACFDLDNRGMTLTASPPPVRKLVGN